MTRCAECNGQMLEETEAEQPFTVAGRTFVFVIPVSRCTQCESFTISYDAMGIVDDGIARELARHGDMSPAVFKRLRKAIDLRVEELAELLHVLPETITRWERDDEPIDHLAGVVVASMVLERLDGRSTLLDRLKAAVAPLPWTEVNQVDTPAETRCAVA